MDEKVGEVSQRNVDKHSNKPLRKAGSLRNLREIVDLASSYGSRRKCPSCINKAIASLSESLGEH